MGGILCCDRRNNERDISMIKSVKLFDELNDEIRTFDTIKLATTPRSRNIAYNDYIPRENECLLLPSCDLPKRLRTVYTNRKCTNITVLFCKSIGKNDFLVQEQHTASRECFDITPDSDGDLIIQCAEIIPYIRFVRLNN